MSAIWGKLSDSYTYLFDELSHPLTKDWFLAPSPLPLAAILIAYNIFCTRVGPAFMKNRPPYKLDSIIKLYNIFQIFISLYISYEGYVYLFSGHFNYNCQGIREGEERVARGIQVYLITKLIELLDTVFFVLRKSDRQITFLHLYHHTLMPTVTWVGLKYFPGGQGVLFGAINSVVHVVMYGYYFLSGLGPQYQKYLWWKKYLTVMQIVQFFIVLVHSLNSMFYSCSYLPVLKMLTILFSSVFIYMFSKFYYLSYIVKRHKPKESSANNKDQITTNGHHGKSDESNGKLIERNNTNNGRSVNGAINSNGIKDVGHKINSSTSNGSHRTDNKQFVSKEKRKDL